MRNSTQNFVIGLEPGETESVSQYLKFVLNSLFQCRFTKQTEEFKERMKKKSSKDEQPPF